MSRAPLTLAPLDEHNLALRANVHPENWKNPEPAARYNLVVIGAGTAGLVSAVGAAGLGAKVAVIERDFTGGDCLNFGCVPSKAILRVARAAAEVRRAGELGIEFAPPIGVDFATVMERMRRLRAEISAHDSVPRLQSLGIDVFLGEGRFVAPDTLEVDKQQLKFRRAAIATGARAASLPVPGLAEAGYLTNETLFSLTELPRRIAVIGGGPLGCEMAQALRRLGASVMLIEVEPRILPRDDPDAAQCLERALRRDGVAIATNAKVLRVEQRSGAKLLRVDEGAAQSEVEVDEIVVGGGREPAVDGLGLEAAGIAFDPVRGIQVDDFLRTSNPLVYAAGDVASELRFTHLADAHARLLLRNALFMGRRRVSALTIPWCTYTDPEIAQVGLSELEARRRGIEVTTYMHELKREDRAILDGASDGYVKLVTRRGSDRIIGASVVASHAGEMISEITVAITAKFGLGRLAEVIHPYPTESDAIRHAANDYT
ncbi:MAG TPA: mercuric reductase, partial [Candidatus Binataceae bacterium]|nr:mercuric reductase [Candidatus Binataceae bacterium]